MPNSTAALKVRFLKSGSGSIGDATRASTTMNAHAASSASTKPPATSGWPSPSGRHSITAATKAVSATIARHWPPRSMPLGLAAALPFALASPAVCGS
jgi:hypothetical protein